MDPVSTCQSLSCALTWLSRPARMSLNRSFRWYFTTPPDGVTEGAEATGKPAPA